MDAVITTSVGLARKGPERRNGLVTMYRNAFPDLVLQTNTVSPDRYVPFIGSLPAHTEVNSWGRLRLASAFSWMVSAFQVASGKISEVFNNWTR